jgi:hypothetical protein
VAALEEEVQFLTYTTHTCAGDPRPDDTYGFSYRDAAGRRNAQMGIPAGQGAASTFFVDAPGQLRFELKEVRLVQVPDPRLNAVRANYLATLIDRRAGKNGREYELRKGDALPVRDVTATLVLAALGEGDNRSAVEEGTAFALPFDTGAAEKPYRFVGVRTMEGRQGIVIECDLDGQPPQVVLAVP